MANNILQGESMAEYYNGLKEGFKYDREQNLQAFNPVGWRKHTDFHFPPRNSEDSPVEALLFPWRQEK